MRIRSVPEYSFRLQQEFANIWLYLQRPSVAIIEQPTRSLPPGAEIAARLRDTAFATEVREIAEQVLRHELPVMDGILHCGKDIQWRWDYQHPGGTGALQYFRRVRYLDPAVVGNYRLIWEFNRHQHLVTVMQAWLFTGDQRYIDEVQRQLESWWAQNPFTEGINWTSALEVGFRALSWIWIYHMGGNSLPTKFRERLLVELYRHGLFLEHNLSIYFSPNTHLQGESIVLHAIGTIFPQFPDSARWRKLGGDMALRQMDVQVRDDGGHFENSTFYQIYALDFFVLHFLLAPTPPAYAKKLEQMAFYTAAISGAGGINPLIGDDDGGRVFHPFGQRAKFGGASLATCGVLFGRPEWIKSVSDLCEQAAWWIGVQALDSQPGDSAPAVSQAFTQTGTAVLNAPGIHIVMDNGEFGWGSGGHSHCDTLSLVVQRDSEAILIDPGTYTYTLPEWRDRFRGSAAHNTVRIDGRDQALPLNPFSWIEKPVCEVVHQRFEDELDFLVAECRYGGLVHRRRVLFLKVEGRLFVLDEIEAADSAEHTAEQFWHPGVSVLSESANSFRVGSARLSLAGGRSAEKSEGGELGWRSTCLLRKEKATVITTSVTGSSPLYLAAVLDLCAGKSGEPGDLRLGRDGNTGTNTLFYLGAEVRLGSRRSISVGWDGK